jgi:hypothetical protein
VELLAVVVVVVVIISLAIPGVTGLRTAARAQADTQKLNTLSRVLTLYHGDHRGLYYNPFISRRPGDGAWTVPLDDGLDPMVHTELTFEGGGHARYAGESFAAYWYAYMRLRLPGQMPPLDTFYSAADGLALTQFNERRETLSEAIFPGSFYYSPVFYRDQSLYNVGQRGVMSVCVSELGRSMRTDTCPTPRFVSAATRLDQVLYPSAKALLFARADFAQTRRNETRPSGTGTKALPPSWSNPGAQPLVLMADGAAIRPRIFDLRRAAFGESDDLLPVDLLEPPDLLPPMPPNSFVSWAIGTQRDGLYPMFFGATRYGVRGRDVVQ